MAKRLQEYVKYTTKELDQYTETEGSCVRKINTNLHLSLGPFCLDDFKHVLMAHLVRSKVGFYDIHLDGIVLDLKNIKVLGNTGALRADDARIHVNINADVYVFKPEEGAELTGVVKHIGPHQVGVILYRVFNANLRVTHKVDKEEVQMDQEVKFRIRKYNLQNVFPYIDGELLTPGAQKALAKNKTVFKQEDNGDSGIEEKDGTQELDNILSVIKTEAPSEFEEALDTCNKKKSKKSKKLNTNSEDSATAESPVIETTTKKSAKKRKSSNSFNTEDNTYNSTEETSALNKKIKRELTYSDDSLPSTPIKIKKEKDSSPSKKRKSKISSSSSADVKVKEEIEDDDD
ncbi:RNA polymerase I subunit F isoform 2-T2 [Cochliomyia hominivorax]